MDFTFDATEFGRRRRSRRKSSKKVSRRRGRSNPMAKKAMKYYQANRHRGVTLKDAWKKVRKH